jgi:hypothetical protein
MAKTLVALVFREIDPVAILVQQQFVIGFFRGEPGWRWAGSSLHSVKATRSTRSTPRQANAAVADDRHNAYRHQRQCKELQ